MAIFTGIPLPEACRVFGQLAGYQGLLFVCFPKLLLVCQYPLGNFDTKNGQRIQVPWSNLFSIQFFFPPLHNKAYFSNNILLLSTIWLKRLTGRVPWSFQCKIYIPEFLECPFGHSSFFPCQKGSPHASSRSGFLCGSLCSAEQDRTLHQKGVAAMAQRQLLEQKGLLSTQVAVFLLSPSFLYLRKFFSHGPPPACGFPTCSAAEPHDGSKPSSQKTMRLSTISRGRRWSPHFPGLWKDFLLFACPLMTAAWYTEHNRSGWRVRNGFRFMAEEVSATDFLHDLRQEVTCH